MVSGLWCSFLAQTCICFDKSPVLLLYPASGVFSDKTSTCLLKPNTNSLTRVPFRVGETQLSPQTAVSRKPDTNYTQNIERRTRRTRKQLSKSARLPDQTHAGTKYPVQGNPPLSDIRTYIYIYTKVQFLMTDELLPCTGAQGLVFWCIEIFKRARIAEPD